MVIEHYLSYIRKKTGILSPILDPQTPYLQLLVRCKLRHSKVSSVSSDIFSHQANVNIFEYPFVGYHFLEVAIRAILRVRLSFKAHGMKESIAVNALE